MTFTNIFANTSLTRGGHASKGVARIASAGAFRRAGARKEGVCNGVRVKVVVKAFVKVVANCFCEGVRNELIKIYINKYMDI